MKKTAFAVGLFCVSLNTFAGGNNGWNADAVPPKQCVIVTGSSSVSPGSLVYRTDDSNCMQGIQEGKVKGVMINSGEFIYNDGSRTTFSGSVSPNQSLMLNSDTSKINKVGLKSWTYQTSWIK